jgi:uncharacterized glyoxalase superfamily protein PhnB
MSGTARLFCYYSYRNASHAIDWLIQAFGFERVRQQDGADSTVLHAELRLGDVVIMVASADADYVMPPLVGRSTGHGAYLLVDDVEAIYARALASGATAVVAPEMTEWGTRRCRVLDPERYEWSFGTYEPGASW